MKQLNKIAGYEEFSEIYWVTRDGEILSEKLNMKALKKRTTKPTLKSRNRYYEVCLMCRGKKVYRKIHRIIAAAFVPNVNNKPQVNHVDEDGLNNNYKNLEWVTAKENSRYSNAKRVFCYNEDGLVKIYEANDDVVKDGFNPGHTASCCRGYTPKNRSNPITRHKGHTFSYKELTKQEVVQRLSK